MNANQEIESYFMARKAEGHGNSIALDKTVSHFFHIFNPMYVRTHICRGPLWT